MQKLKRWFPRRSSYPGRFLWTEAEAEAQAPKLSGPPVEPDTCISLVKKCTSLHSLKIFHASMLRSHLHLNRYFLTNLVAQYIFFGSISHAYSLFSCSHSIDPFLWNVMIRGFVDHAQYYRSILLYNQMLQLGVPPDNFTFPFVLKASTCLNDIKLGVQIHDDIVEFGYESDIVVSNSLITMYAKCGCYEFSRHVFDKMSDRSVISWSAIISACSVNDRFEEGVSLFWQMLHRGIRPNRAVILNVMSCISRQDEANDICRVAAKFGFNFDQHVQSAALRMYARCGRTDLARCIFDGILNKDLVTWASMIEAYVQTDLPLEALCLLKKMMLQRMLPDSVTLLSVVRAASALASFQCARAVHGIIVLTGGFFNNKLAVETALVDLYVKCGILNYARQVFDRMQDRNIISWNTMISGYGTHGHGIKAYNLFNQMKASVKPDHIAFVSVLSACSHAGLVAEGWECFNSMARDFGIAPRSEHYACMVDLLGRAGKLDEARVFITRMPIRPDAAVWGALLGACRIHSNVHLAEMAAKALLVLDADNPGRYVLMSNIYASSGKKEDADRMRTLMKYRNLKKMAGHAII